MEALKSVGVVVWVEGLKVKFRVSEGAFVERGQLLKVEGGSRFLIRVYDFEPVSLLTPAEIARISHKKSRGEDVELLDKPLRYYDAAKAVIIAQLDGDGRVHSPTGSPALFSEVLELSEEDLRRLHLDDGDLEIGVVRSGHRPTGQKVLLKGDSVFPHHMLVCSVTGGGKTNFCKVLCSAVMDSEKYSLVIIDTEGEYFDGGGGEQLGLAHLPSAEKRLLYITQRAETPGRLSFTFTWNGMLVTRRVEAYPLKIWWGDLHPEDFCQTGLFTPPQEALLWLAYREAGEDWLNLLMDNSIADIYLILKGKSQKSTIAVTKRKLRMLVGDTSIFSDEPIDVNLAGAVLDAVKRGMVVLVDMPMATEAQEILLSVLLARRIFQYYERMRKLQPEEWLKLPTVLIVVEEAHRYLSKRKIGVGGNIFEEISKRGRKYRVGLCCITQMPSEIDDLVLRQQLTKIVLPLPTKADYQAVISHSPFLDDAEVEIRTLDRGEALIISTPSGIKFAAPVKIYKFEELVERKLEEASFQGLASFISSYQAGRSLS